MEKKKFKLGLLPKLLIAIVLGIIIGQFFPVWFCRVVVTASSIFSSFLKFIIPLMIVAYVTMGIADLKSGAGKLLLITVALAYGSTLIAGSASYLVSANLFPSFMSEGALEQIAATADNSLASYISISIPPILDTLSAVVLAFVLGLCMSTLRGKTIGEGVGQRPDGSGAEDGDDVGRRKLPAAARYEPPRQVGDGPEQEQDAEGAGQRVHGVHGDAHVVGVAEGEQRGQARQHHE